MTRITRVVKEAHLVLKTLRPEDRRALEAAGVAALGLTAAGIYVTAWADLGAIIGLCIGLYCGITLQDAFHAIVATLTPSTRSERRRARRMARAAGVMLPEAAE